MGQQLNEALKLIERGFAVIAVHAGRKNPRGEGWQNKFFRTQDDARRHWAQYPNDNLGALLTHCKKYVSVDLDCVDGFKDEYLKLFPRTWTVRTRNGVHLYFKRPNLDVNRIPLLVGDPRFKECILSFTGKQHLLPGCIVEFDNNDQPVAPHEYSWYADPGGELSPYEMEVAECPPWFFDSIVDRKVKETIYEEGGRHNSLIKVATAMAKRGEPIEVLEAELRKVGEEKCNPPLGEREIKDVIKWAASLAVNPEDVKKKEKKKSLAARPEALNLKCGDGEYVVPLGFRDDEYFYTSSSNRQVVKIKDVGHTSGKLLGLMPMPYWESLGYRTTNGGIDWTNLASDLLETCRSIGIFDEKKTRGIGCWTDRGRLVVHIGEKLLVDGQEMETNQIDSDHIYALGPSLPHPYENPLSIKECGALVDLCRGLDWVNPGSGVLLAGGMAVFRVCGALPWRPHFWLSSPRGAGKTTIITQLVNTIAGRWGVFVEGNSSEAGIRQEVRHQAIPITYDEAETNNRQGDNRMQRILELVRQASSESEGRILKGTVDGRGMNFKINASFFLGSINVNLQNEADKSRFTVLELKRGEMSRWGEIRKLYDPITKEFGDRLFSRVLRLYPVLMQNLELFQRLVGEKTDARTGQQYGILLAGWALLHSDTAIDEAGGREMLALVPQLMGGEHRAEEESDEHQCLQWLLSSQIEIEEVAGGSVVRKRVSIAEAIQEAQGVPERCVQLQRCGMDVRDEMLCIRSSHPKLAEIFRDQKWATNWNGALGRLPSVQRSQQIWLFGKQGRGVKVPLKTIFPQ